MTGNRLVARNSALSLFGQLAPVFAALAAIPFLVRGFGADRFGLLMLVQAAIGYFNIFELGLGRALTQSVAQRLANGKSGELPVVARTGLAMLLVLGVVGGALLASVTPFLCERILKIPPELTSEAVRSFRIMSIGLPFVLLTAGLRGLIEAHQHFGLATALRLPAGVVTYVGPLLILPFSNSLVPAVSMIVGVRAASFVAHWFVARRRYEYLRTGGTMAREPVFALLRFGAWMTVTNIVSPMMAFLDRFVIGAVLSLAAVTAYVTPYEAVAKLLIIPAAIAAAVLPALASTLVARPEHLHDLYSKSFRAEILVMFPVVHAVVVLAPEILVVWVGAALPPESVVVLRWLAIGVFVTAIAFTPTTALYSAGRPDLLAKLHLLELPLYAAGIVILLPRYGIVGVAIAWTARAALDAGVIIWLARRSLGVRPVPIPGGLLSLAVMFAAIAAGATLDGSGARLGYTAVSIAAFGTIAWRKLLTPVERQGIGDWIRGAGAPAVSSVEP